MPDNPLSDRQWLENWKTAAPELAEIRRRELQQVDVAHVIEALSDAFEIALRNSPPRTTSGLVELEALLAKGQR